MKTLRGKLTLIIAIGVIGVLAMTLFIINKVITNNIEEDVKNEMTIVLNHANNSIKNSIKVESEDSIFTSLEDTSKLFNCYVFFKGKKEENYAGKYVDLEILNKHKKSLESENKTVLSIDKKGELFLGTLTHHLYVDGKSEGSIIIQKSYRDKYLTYKKIEDVLLLTQILSVIVLLILIYFIIKRNTKELEILAIDIKKFGKGKQTKKTFLKRKDEIGILRNEFNFMEENIMKLQAESKEFFEMGAHELKTPLTAIKGYSDLLLNEAFEDEFVITAIERINEESNKMKKLTENLLTISREEEKINIYKEDLNIEVEVTNILRSLETILLNKDIEVNKHIEIENITCFKEDFRIVLSNLISNSIKYSSENKIFIKVKKEKVFIIKNKIKDQEIFKKDIFKPFVKGTISREEISSSGLGLYICKKICERNAWKINYNIAKGYIEFILIIK